MDLVCMSKVLLYLTVLWDVIAFIRAFPKVCYFILGNTLVAKL